MKKIYFVILGALTLTLFFRVTPAHAVSRNWIPVKAAIVMDSSGAVLYSKFPNARLAPASTVKLVTAMVVIDNLDISKKVVVSRNASRVRSIPPRLRADDELTVSDLLHLALMKSVNSAAVALAEATSGSEKDFAVLMNRKAKEIGAHNTLFANASGYPRSGPQYTTAADLALIMKAALSYPLIRDILGKKQWAVTTTAGRELFIENSNALLWQTDAAIVGKTGYTGNARHCFVCAVNTDKGPLYTAVLGARSRNSLWKSTLMLTAIGMNPQLAAAREPPRRTRRSAHKKEAKVQSADSPAEKESVPR